MDNVELGAELKRIRKDELGMTQLELVEKTGLEIKKLSRLECGYQIPDKEFLNSLDQIGYDTEHLRRLVDYVKRRQHIIRRKHLAPATETLAKDIEQIKTVVANNNAILREVLKTLRQMQSSQPMAPAQADLFNQALQPMEL